MVTKHLHEPLQTRVWIFVLKRKEKTMELLIVHVSQTLGISFQGDKIS